MVTPLVALCEAASRLRADAVVSLQQVLGEVGPLLIDSAVVTAIVPFSPDRPVPSLGTLHTQGGDFHFRGMPASILDAGRESDRLVEADYLRATPEAALLHWLYLSRSPRSTLTAPPMEIAIGELSAARLSRLSKAMNLEKPLEQWLNDKHAFDQTANVYEQAHVELAPGSP